MNDAPNVVTNDGTLNTVVISPLRNPTNRPTASPAATPDQVPRPSVVITFATTTPHSAALAPIEG